MPGPKAMAGLSGLLLAVAPVHTGLSAAELPEPYTCSVAMEIDGLRGGMWRDFYPGRPDDFYVVQFQHPEIDTGPFAIWRIDNRPAAPPRAYGYLVGRPEARTFIGGPDSVSFGVIDYGDMRDGPIWVRLFGNGLYAGAFLAQSARDTRRTHRHGGRGLWLSVSQPRQSEIVAQLAAAEEWQAVLVDASGRELGRKSVRVPTATRIAAEFSRARAALLRHRADYLAAGALTGAEGPAPCARMPSDGETI